MIDGMANGSPGKTAATLFTAILLFACGDGGTSQRPLGATCELASECESGLCADNRCVDPEGDEDQDGLSNALEVEIGTNPFDPDTDGDGSRDADELATDFSPRDSDGDGLQDAVESAKEDADSDCIVDQADRRNTTPDGATSGRLGDLCPAKIGVCGAAGAALRVMCPDGLDSPVCDFAEVPDYEATETRCDAQDNDCDGTVDPGCDALAVGLIGHWKLDNDGQDAGPHADHGTVSGATGTADRFGNDLKAMRFSTGGDNVVVSVTHHPKGDFTGSYSVWVRPDRDTDGGLGVFSFGEALEKNHGSGVSLTGDRHCAGYLASENDVASDLVCAPAGHWSHVVVTKNGHDITFYLDGRKHGVEQLAAGQNLVTTALVIGMAKDLGNDTSHEPFFGAIDDLRAWDRVLSESDIQLLFNDGGWTATGSPEHPAQSCLHVRDAGRGKDGGASTAGGGEGDGVPATGTFTLDVDGDGPRAAFDVYCDMDLDGGGWTLAWVYGFTDFASFDAPANAVTPIPSWPVSEATVPVSTTPPTSPTTPGAINWAVWKELGRSFAVISDLNDGIACEPGAGSLSDGLDGWIDCDMVVDVSSECQGTVPSGVYFSRLGPALYAQDLYYYFEGSESENFPTHDPCGLNAAEVPANPARAGGAVYLRETNRQVQWPTQCDYVSGLQRETGPRKIDPDGLGGLPAFEVACDFDIERGGWTALSDEMLASIAAREDVSREFLYRDGDAFYRSPPTVTTWTKTYTEAPGRWLYAGANGAGAAVCGGGGAGTGGVGCSDAGFSVVPDSEIVAGALDLCQSPPDAFGNGQGCEPAEVWVRENACAPDAGSLLGDGGLDGVAAAIGSWQSPCWYAFGPDGWLDTFTVDATDFPPGGRAPSLKVSNPTLGNDIFAIELGQQQLTFIAGRTYTLSFWAKASAARTLRAFVQSVDLVRVTHEDIAITTEWTRYELAFEASTTMWNAMVNMQLAEVSTATLWIDGFRLTEAAAP